jgi:N-acetyl-anhydromuramyl-L-alanine amidase AmpD
MLSPNQEYGRRGNKILGFIIHMTEGSFKSAIDWCTNPKSQVSYHFIIDKNGDDVTLVMPENTAWHAGKRIESAEYTKILGLNPNLTTIGIAMAGFAEIGPTAQQIAKCAKLINILATYYNIMLDKKSIIPHHDIRADKVCPGIHVDYASILYLSKLSQA